MLSGSPLEQTAAALPWAPRPAAGPCVRCTDECAIADCAVPMFAPPALFPID